MECKYVRHGASSVRWGRRSRLRLADAAAVRGAAAGAQLLSAVGTAHRLRAFDHDLRVREPFISNMDEISYWIYTKRAPCLMNYDNVVKKQNVAVHCPKAKPKSVPSVAVIPTPIKKKKIKLSVLEDDSLSEKPQNVYFNASQRQKKTLGSESDTVSDIDFNIKNSSVQKKSRKKLQKHSKTTLHKKNTLATSTPKVSTLRRSLRQAQQSLNNNTQVNSSFEIYNASIINGNNSFKCCAIEHKPDDKAKKTAELLAGGDQSTDNKKTTTVKNILKTEVLHSEFEDLSDVSGFTANYIRSTKLQSTKTPRKFRCKNNRNLMKESQTSLLKDNTIVCLNKSMNTGLPNTNILNCSTDSSQIVINLVTTKSNEKPTKVNKSTSILKFMDTRTSKSRESVPVSKQHSKGKQSKANLNISFESCNGTTSRYPIRHKSSVARPPTTNNTSGVLDKTNKTGCKNPSEFNNSDRKENPAAVSISKTRSGRSIGLTLRPPENSVLVLSNSTEQVSSMASMNVATAGGKPGRKTKRKRHVTKDTHVKKCNVKSVSLKADSLRDKSGFAACFSESDEDSEPLKRRKFFCA